MISFSYTFSFLLRNSLAGLDRARQDILLTIVPPRTELALRWDATVDRVSCNTSLGGSPIPKLQVIRLLLGHQKSKDLTSSQREAVGFRQAFSYLAWEWPMSKKTITFRTLLSLHGLLFQHGPQSPQRFLRGQTTASFTNARDPRNSHALPPLSDIEPSLRALFLDLQIKKDHPVIQAATAHMQLVRISPFGDGNGRIARLLGYLLLYKYGYDCRGLLNLETFFDREAESFQRAASAAFRSGNLTSWLEYYAHAVEAQMEEVLELLKKAQAKRNDTINHIVDLNERQRSILEYLEKPDLSITNRVVQKKFGVSQITASRDLAKVATLGLVAPHGKGRSIAYSRFAPQ